HESPAGKGCTSPQSPRQGSVEPAERSDSFRHPGEPQRIKVLRKPGQRRGYAEPGDAAQSALSRRRPAGSACLSPEPPFSARHHSAPLARSLLWPRLALAPPLALSPRPVPPLELGLQARGARAELSKAEEAPPRLARLQLQAVQANRGGEEGRVHCPTRVAVLSALLCGLPGQNNTDSGSLNVGFLGSYCHRLESRVPHVSVPPSGRQHGSVVPASPGIRQARRDALSRLAKRGEEDPTIGLCDRGLPGSHDRQRASLRPTSLLKMGKDPPENSGM
ncbi:LOW QUALITY PROTEIN: uncharacterized protein LOC124527165, partial [Lynx rufus]|uniref:LOW QUALITY PROTEIN: uncharacterized protein LOC124527165 n=1 Tax=Lynx rufus TaxID=61384 RepID=UPI001F127066